MNKSNDNPFMIFLRGYWELPVERPVLYLSFLRGAILSVIISMIFGFSSIVELIAWAAAIGALWTAIDLFTWKRYSKKMGDK